LGGSETQLYFEALSVQDFRNPTWVEKDLYTVHSGRWCLGKDGTVYAAQERNKYAITVYDSRGQAELIISKEEKPYQRTGKEKEQVAANARFRGRRAPHTFSVEVEDTEPAISSLRVDETGQLWVLSSRGDRNQPEGILCSYDVFARQGQYVQRIQVVCPGDTRQDRLVFLGNGLVIQITDLTDALNVMRGRLDPTNEDSEEDTEGAPMEIICYRIGS